MKKFWIICGIALLGGSIAGERGRALLINVTAQIHSFSFSEDAAEGRVAIVGKELDGFSSVLVAAAGMDAGVKKGDRAIAHNNVYVGSIGDVSPQASRIMLASRPGERFTAWLPVLSVPVAFEGWGAGLLRGRVPAHFPIEVGDEIWYDARLDVFVGTVIAVRDTPDLFLNQDEEGAEAGATKEIFARHAINPLMLSSVFIRSPMASEIEP